MSAANNIVPLTYGQIEADLFIAAIGNVTGKIQIQSSNYPEK